MILDYLECTINRRSIKEGLGLNLTADDQFAETYNHRSVLTTLGTTSQIGGSVLERDPSRTIDSHLYKDSLLSLAKV